MAWKPSTTFEDDLVDLQPNHNFVHGQLAYEAQKAQEYAPRPQAHYDFLINRQRRNAELEKLHGPVSAKSKEIRAGLAMMEQIQQISGTKPLGEHATIADLEDRSTVEQEAVAIMRHYGMMSMADGAFIDPNEPPQLGRIHIMGTGHRTLPLILDPAYFEPCKKSSSINNSLNSSYKTSSSDGRSEYFTAESGAEAALYENDSLSLSNVKQQQYRSRGTNSSNFPNSSSTFNEEDIVGFMPPKHQTQKARARKSRPNQQQRAMPRKGL